MDSRDKAIQLDGSVWMTVDGDNFGGAGRIALLAAIAQCGSITQAAKAVKMSYKAAWDAIDTMNTLAGEALVERVAGGKGGGGTRLTVRGQRLADNFRRVENAHQRFIAQLNLQADGMADDYLLIKGINMKTSARNQFLGKVIRIKAGAVNDEIELAIADGRVITAIITRESTESLNLAVGAEVFALVKASSIIVMTGVGEVKLSARNRLRGTVSRVIPGAVNTEVVIDLGGASSIAAIITNDSSVALELADGIPVMAIFKASSVILGVPA